MAHERARAAAEAEAAGAAAEAASATARMHEASSLVQRAADEAVAAQRSASDAETLEARRRSLEQLQETFGESMGAMIGFMVVIAGVIAFGSVLNAALVALSEREREVGTLRVLGYTPWQVAGIFVEENAILGCVGVGVGLGLGVGLNLLVATAYSTELYRFPVVVRGGTVLWIVGIMLGILAATQAVVVRLVRRLDWLQSLKTKE